MKHFITISFVFLLCFKLAKAQQAPTFAEPPGPEHVLVVFNSLELTSKDVKDYYLAARNIPAVNVVGIMKF